MIRSILFVLIAACGQPALPVPPRPVVVTRPPPVAAQLHIDPSPTRLGGPPSWGTATDVEAIRFCPGDRELVALDDSGVVRRYRVADGLQLAATPGLGNERLRVGAGIDCRADGTALTLDHAGSPVLIDPAGAVTRPPSPIAADNARFAADGSVWAVTEDGVTAWNGASITRVITSGEHALYNGIGGNGVYVERIFQAGAARDGLWMVRDGVRIKLPGTIGDMTIVEAAPDGGLAIGGDMAMTAFGWIPKGKKRILLLDQSGTHIDGVAVTNKWFAVADAGGTVWTADRPKMTWGHIEKPCGEYPNAFAAMAIANDDHRIAVACYGVGIRIFDIDTNRLLTKDLPNSAADRVRWSPSGDWLATSSGDRGPIRLWRGTTLVRRIDSDARPWWISDTELLGNDGTRWKVPSGEATEPPTRAYFNARSPNGVTLNVERDGAVMFGTTKLQLPASKLEWIASTAIDNAGVHAVVRRGQYNGHPTSEVIELDVAANKVDSFAMTTTAAAIGDGFIVIAAPDGELALRRHGALTKLGSHGSKVTSLAIWHDVVAAGGEDGRITLWSAAGTALGTLTAHTVAVEGLAFTPDGKRLASTAADGTLIWAL